MLAYSSVAHAGYIAIGLVLLARSTEAAPFAVAGGILHAFSHAIMTAGVFVVVAVVGAMAHKDGQEDIYHLDNYAGLGKRAPVTAILMAILLFSLAGVPPTLGFYTKFVLFLSAIRGELLWLAIIAVLNSALSVFYYARIVMYMYWGKPEGERIDESPAYMVSLVVAVVLILVLGLYPEPLYRFALNAAEVLLS
jgi:NADH-quinone oxidoreductase subunit N